MAEQVPQDNQEMAQFLLEQAEPIRRGVRNSLRIEMKNALPRDVNMSYTYDARKIPSSNARMMASLALHVLAEEVRSGVLAGFIFQWDGEDQINIEKFIQCIEPLKFLRLELKV